MDIGSLLLILALLLLVGMFVARPFFNRNTIEMSSRTDLEDHEMSSLLAERDRILTALQELDFDHALGKIPEGEYPVQRELLVKQGANIYRELDRYAHDAPVDEAELRLEAAIAARSAAPARTDQLTSGKESVVAIAGGGAKLAIAADDEIESLLATRRRGRNDKYAGFCPQCGRPVQKSDRFCPKCGKALS
jgi:hypothetical protein